MRRRRRTLARTAARSRTAPKWLPGAAQQPANGALASAGAPFATTMVRVGRVREQERPFAPVQPAQGISVTEDWTLFLDASDRGTSAGCLDSLALSVLRLDQLHRAAWPGGSSKPTVGRAKRPVQRLGQSDVARIVGGYVCAQLERSVQQSERGEPGKGKVDEVVHRLLEPLVGDRAGQPSSSQHSGRLDVDQIRRDEPWVGTKQSPGPSAGLIVVTDGVDQHGGVDDDHPRDRSSARSATACARPTRPPRRASIRPRTSSRVGEAASRMSSRGTAAVTGRAPGLAAGVLGARLLADHGSARWACLHSAITRTSTQGCASDPVSAGEGLSGTASQLGLLPAPRHVPDLTTGHALSPPIVTTHGPLRGHALTLRDLAVGHQRGAQRDQVTSNPKRSVPSGMPFTPGVPRWKVLLSRGFGPNSKVASWWNSPVASTPAALSTGTPMRRLP